MNDHDDDRYVTPPVVSRTATITETPQGVTRSISVTVTGGTPWEADQLMHQALTDTRQATEAAYLATLGGDLRRRNDRAETCRIFSIDAPTPVNGYARNLDLNEGA